MKFVDGLNSSIYRVLVWFILISGFSVSMSQSEWECFDVFRCLFFFSFFLKLRIRCHSMDLGLSTFTCPKCWNILCLLSERVLLFWCAGMVTTSSCVKAERINRTVISDGASLKLWP